MAFPPTGAFYFLRDQTYPFDPRGHPRGGPLFDDRVAPFSFIKRSWKAWDLVAPGGKSLGPGRQFVQEQRPDELPIEVGLRQGGVARAQGVEAQDALEPLERHLDLPAQAIDGQDLFALYRGRKRGQHEEVARAFQGPRVGHPALALGLPQDAPPGDLCRRSGLAWRHQACWEVSLLHDDPHPGVADAGLGQPPQEREELPGLPAFAVPEGHPVPGQADDKVRLPCRHRGQRLGMCVSAIGHQDVPRPQRISAHRLPAADVGEDELVEAAAAGVVPRAWSRQSAPSLPGRLTVVASASRSRSAGSPPTVVRSRSSCPVITASQGPQRRSRLSTATSLRRPIPMRSEAAAVVRSDQSHRA